LRGAAQTWFVELELLLKLGSSLSQAFKNLLELSLQKPSNV
jgi:hypothetical protein